MVQIIDVNPQNNELVQQIAEVMVAGFKQGAPDYVPDVPAALEEIGDCHEEGKISLAAVDDDGLVLGWIGGRHEYGLVWELHPLVVHPFHHKRGIGRMLVAALETRVKERGGLTLILGTDDHTGQTSLYGVDLYPEIWQHIPAIQNLKGHSFEFYQKVGFVICGLVPDANGVGQPDILMVKRLSL